eukprot:CAMPEP_0172555308 /NCGR_PEP_ID=MMETSP1067-20121228/58346_1 /TAXON_ID=265564 ORGANISM="Thalassiosira punctigera, Strain Tpunct2005C2" /NCGR_SAMPLE_ID=MMETSP1067 /ASSEMBLY_ACC=CAM_ASM_000444 /LENGTH=395 /DNA_ID=CAMNT_0013343823 /DNA_START=199 /DNA_END=1386 /DNA_ORIENTATION=-
MLSARRRGRAVAPSSALMLLLSLQSLFSRASSYRTSSSQISRAVASRRGASSWNTSPCGDSIIQSSSQLYSQKSTYMANDVVELQYSEFLPPSTASSNTPVIFLHGLLGNKRNFASLASSLSTQLQKPRPIYTVDLRNHGENTHDWRPSMSYSEMARDVLAFMDKVSDLNNGHEKAVLVGHSMGGKVAQSLALMHPERVEGLVVLDIAPVRYYSEKQGMGGGRGGDDSGWKAVEEIVRSVAQIDLSEGGYLTKRDVDAVLRRGMLEDPALRAFVLTNLEQRRASGGDESPLRWKIYWDGIVHELDRIAGFDVNDRVMDDSAEETELTMRQSDVQYEGDVFFIHGGASRFVRHSHISTIGTFFPNHMLTTIRGVGHWVHAEAPDDTIALLKRYLDR